MKKRILLLTLALCLLLAGCGKAPKKGETSPEELESNEPMLGYDAQNKYLLFQLPSFQETDGFYFGSTWQEQYLHYYDKSSGVSGFLCADPSCAHNSSDCAAYIGCDNSLSYYDGKFYWVDQSRQSLLWRSNLDGSNREKIKPVDFINIVMVYQPQQYTIHRGKLYFWGNTDTVVGTQAGRRATLVSTTLDGSEEFTTLYDQTFDRWADPTFRFVGNHVYLMVKSYVSREPARVTVTKFDVDTGESEVVYDEDAVARMVRNFWVTQEGEIYLSGANLDRSYFWKVSDGERVEIASWEDEGNLLAPAIVDGLAVHDRFVDGVHFVDIVNFSGETIYSGELFPEKVLGLTGDPSVGDYGYLLNGGNTEKLIVNLVGREKYPSATVLIDLTDNMKATVLWTSED